MLKVMVINYFIFKGIIVKFIFYKRNGDYGYLLVLEGSNGIVFFILCSLVFLVWFVKYYSGLYISKVLIVFTL